MLVGLLIGQAVAVTGRIGAGTYKEFDVVTAGTRVPFQSSGSAGNIGYPDIGRWSDIATGGRISGSGAFFHNLSFLHFLETKRAASD